MTFFLFLLLLPALVHRDAINQGIAELVSSVIARYARGETIMGMHEADNFCERYIDPLFPR